MHKRVRSRTFLRRIMRISLLQLVLAVLFTGLSLAHDGRAQNPLNRRITLRSQNQKIDLVLDQLSKQAGVRFLYSPEIIQADRRITLDARQQRLEQVLDELLTPLRIRYEVVGQQVLLKRMPTDSQPAPGDDHSASTQTTIAPLLPITGRVVDTTGYPVPGATILLKGSTNTGTATDANGRFTLSVPDGAGTLVVSSIGYVAKEIPINNRTTIEVTLQADTKSLNEVVVVGYGTQNKRDVTGSTARVTAAQITAVPVMSPEQALQGRAAGVQLIQSNNAPGGSAQVQIRGVSSFNGGTANEPLYVIDGVPLSTVGGDNPNNGSPLATINPNDIESMDILKDASATAIYGSRAANGVVVITTKSGKAGRTRFNLDYYYGVQDVRRKYTLLNATEAMVLQNEAILNERGTATLNNTYTESFNPYSYATNPGLQSYDWQDILFRQGRLQDISLSASGGTEKSQFSTSVAYYENEGVVKNSNMRRLSIRGNIDAQPTKRITLGLRSNFSSQWGNQAWDFDLNNGIITRAIESNPFVPALNPDGSYFGVPSTVNTATSFYGDFGTNPYYELMEEKKSLLRNRIQGSVFGEIELAKGLKFRSSFGGDFNLTNFHTSFVPIPRGPYNLLTSYFSSTGRVADNNSFSINWVADQLLTYTNNFGKNHQITALLGFSAQSFFVRSANVRGDGSPNANLDQINNIAGFANTLVVSGGTSVAGLVSQFVRVNYGFRDKYLFTGTVRRDGSSRFGPANRYGTFPSASVGWRVSEEPFAKAIPVFSDIKLRASWGLTGNQNIGDFRFISTTGTANYAWGNTTAAGVAPGNIANPNLQWEANEQIDGGLDLSLLNGRIGLTLDYFVRRSQGLLFNVPVPLSSGFGSQTGNLGKVENKGWEFALNSTNLTGAFRWTTNANLSFIRNRVVDIGTNASGMPNVIQPGFPNGLGYNVALDANPTVTTAGYPIGSFYGYVFDGIIQNQAEAEAAPKIANVSSVPGDVRYKDVSGPNGVPDGLITTDDRVVIGNPFPKFFGGITNEFSYKGFSLSLFANFTVGNDIFNLARMRGLLRRGAGLADQLNRWTGEGSTNDYPRALYSGANFTANNRFSSRFLEDGSFLRLRTATLAYNLPTALINKVRLNSARLYVTASNLFVLTRYSGGDPEVSGNSANVQQQGFDNANYPAARSFVFGVNLAF